MTIVWILSYLATFLLGVVAVHSFGAFLNYQDEKKDRKAFASMQPPKIEDRVHPQPPPPVEYQNNQN